MKHSLPQSLIDAIKNETLIPFVGEEYHQELKTIKIIKFKNWTNSLIDAVKLLKDEGKNNEATNVESKLKIFPVDYLAIASKIHKYLNSHWNKYLAQIFDKNFENINQESLQIPKEILKINNLIITTNYDNVFKWACENKNDLKDKTRSTFLVFIKIQ